MRDQEYAVLDQLLRSLRPRDTLEIGMANGGSTLVICKALRDFGAGTHVAIDPFQNDPEHWASKGMERLRGAGLDDWVELREDYDYLALPELVKEGRVFDFVLVDGWHSFDHTLLDIFYADQLLRDGGVVAVHDTGWPGVHKACRFLETHKPYDRISPKIGVIIPSLAGRAARRVRQMLGGFEAVADARRRRTQWFSLAAYRKLQSRPVPDDFFEPF